MRYPQLFATKAIEKALDSGVKKGIIWHTQGSGKTALAYYNTRFLTDYFQRKGVIPKFYFIVDRLDLLIQAQRELAGRGLVVHTIDSREAFAKDIKTSQVIHNNSGKPEITVVNIQKFSEDSTILNNLDYSINIQRIYFLDEVHRSYNPKGSFLANLMTSDINAVKIGHWVVFKVCSNINLGLRDLDFSNPAEEAIHKTKRGFYPLQSLNSFKNIPESTVINRGISKTLSNKYHFEIPDVPFIKNNFSTRIHYSDVLQETSFKNGHRVFRRGNFQDYSNEYGALIKLVE
jgi:hypothetical protein